MAVSKLLRQDLQAVGEALEGRNYKLLFAGVFILLSGAYAVLTDIVVLSDGVSFNPNLKLLQASLVIAIAFLSSLTLTLVVYRSRTLGARIEKKNFLGSAAGVFATACPICQPIWLVWLGLASQSLFLIEISAYVALASIALLLASLHFAAQNIANKTCGVPLRKRDEKMVSIT